MELLAKKLLVDKYYHADSRSIANDVVRKFIVDKQLVVTGGLVVDFALRLKGEKIYEDFEVPDYDFFSTTNARDASELFELLMKAGFDNISLVPGLHPSTIKIFVFKDCVADITFASEAYFAELVSSALTYDGILFRNPAIQYTDMHRALCHPYENEPRETINHRWVKDFQRFMMLYSFYPVPVSAEPSLSESNSKLRTQYIIAGNFASDYYIGTKSNPIGDHVYLMDDTDYEDFVTQNGNKMKDIKRYQPYQELMPSRTEFELAGERFTVLHCRNKVSIYHVEGQNEAQAMAIAAARRRVASRDNSQVIMSGLRIVSINFCIIYNYSMFQITRDPRYSYYYARLLELTYKAYNDGDRRYFPSIVTYGVELEKSIIIHTNENPADKVPQVHIASDDSEDVKAEQLAKLPHDFVPPAEVYDLSGKEIN
jgi:hypothetical protein